MGVSVNIMNKKNSEERPKKIIVNGETEERNCKAEKSLTLIFLGRTSKIRNHRSDQKNRKVFI